MRVEFFTFVRDNATVLTHPMTVSHRMSIHCVLKIVSCIRRNDSQVTNRFFTPSGITAMVAVATESLWLFHVFIPQIGHPVVIVFFGFADDF